jgi:hypothetical protein
MGRMCCPVRDDDVAALKEINEVVPTFKGILEVSFSSVKYNGVFSI